MRVYQQHVAILLLRSGYSFVCLTYHHSIIEIRLNNNTSLSCCHVFPASHITTHRMAGDDAVPLMQSVPQGCPDLRQAHNAHDAL